MTKTLILIVLCFSSVLLLSQPIELVNADSLLGANIPGQRIRNFYGNVHLKQGNVDVFSDKAIQFLDFNEADLIGNVRIHQDNLLLTAPKVHYKGNSRIAYAKQGVIINDGQSALKADSGVYELNTRIARFYSNVIVEDDSADIFSDTIIYHRADRRSYANGKVVIKGKESNSILFSDALINFPQKNYSVASGSPLLFQIDTSSDEDSYSLIFDTLSISCDSMEAFRSEGNEYYIFRHNVKIHRRNLSAKAETAWYYKDEGFFVLTGVPVLWYDSTQLQADSINIFIPDNNLNLISSYGSSFLLSKDDSLNQDRINQIAGNIIEIDFESDTIVSVVSEGNAKSLYFLLSDKEPDGLSRVGSEKIKVLFAEGTANEIVWLEGIKGDYIPEKIVYSKASEYYLPGFSWAIGKPGMQKPRFRVELLE